jgi:hypothetical protein
MIESEALFGIDGTRKYFYATPRSISWGGFNLQ